MVYNTESDCNDVAIVFKYRELSDSKKVHMAVSGLNYADMLKVDKIDFKKSEELSKINNNKNLIRFLNVIPLDSVKDKFGTVINKKHIFSEGGYITEGVLYKYSEKIDVFIYNENKFSYNGIVYKKGQIYLKFSDTIVENKDYNLIRRIGNYILYIKDCKILFLENHINSILIPQKK
jgi:hypothetical protein